ncbi:hypothetical protein PVL29_024981 [Vitis rotundifolia]|uniref:Terpene synthase metal-binding domain-containing protein n=1 Tax=Vitis rotundifolia TaxID=103349 RepID=A0AA38YT76_VITRO|nr:hypothetical protein PVL29_024981 [Vitis rotundifolia]
MYKYVTLRNVCLMKIQVECYFDEAQWFHEGHVPTIEEYMQVARVREMITKEAFDWVYNDPFTVASCLIVRLMNDMTTHKQMKANSSFFHRSACNGN